MFGTLLQFWYYFHHPPVAEYCVSSMLCLLNVLSPVLLVLQSGVCLGDLFVLLWYPLEWQKCSEMQLRFHDESCQVIHFCGKKGIVNHTHDVSICLCPKTINKMSDKMELVRKKKTYFSYLSLEIVQVLLNA